jgi:DNA topoisomerase IB
VRLRRSDPRAPGYGRHRRGPGFSYVDAQGRPLRDPAELTRIKELVIPPAWRDVWICTDPRGHIQATGTDAAGRRQYLYHPAWRQRRDAAKFDHVLAAARRLPRLRRRVAQHLRRPGLPRERVLAAMVSLLDRGLFRIGGDQYATGEDATFGLATLQADHVSLVRGEAVFCYPAKGGIERECRVGEADIVAVLRALVRPRAGTDRLFAYRNGRSWRELRSDDLNAYLRELGGQDITAKDFRTWHATVLAAMLLAQHEHDGSVTRRRRAAAGVMRAVAEELGNTPAVARSSYVDPRVVDLFLNGTTIPPTDAVELPAPPTVERAVLSLLDGDG